MFVHVLALVAETAFVQRLVMAWSRYSSIRNQFDSASRWTFCQTNLAKRRSGIKHSCLYLKSPKSRKSVMRVHFPPVWRISRRGLRSHVFLSLRSRQFPRLHIRCFLQQHQYLEESAREVESCGNGENFMELRSGVWRRDSRDYQVLYFWKFKFSYKQSLLLFSFVDDLEGFAVYKKPHDEMKTRTGDSWSFDFRTNEEYGALL